MLKDKLNIGAYSVEQQSIIEKAISDGIYLKAPNGEDTNLSPIQWVQVRTEAFKNWFGDWENNKDESSKILDKNGEPVVMYHGSKSRFNTFDIEKAGVSNKMAKLGFWFTPIESFASSFAENSWWGEDENVTSYSTFLSIKNPKVYEKRDVENEIVSLEKDLFVIRDELKLLREKWSDNGFDWSAYESFHLAIRDGFPSEEIKEFYANKTPESGKAISDGERFRELLVQEKVLSEKLSELRANDPYEQLRTELYKIAGMKASDANIGGTGMAMDNEDDAIRKLKESLMAQGYDGIIIKGTEYDWRHAGGVNDQYVALYPNQIKSAVENTSTFSLENDDIRFREVIEKDGEKSLIGLHNISEDKLLKALKLGGLANPSAAVIDINRQSHNGYGDISLILPSAMIDKRKGRNAGTWPADAWTPTYPPIERQFDDVGSERFSNDLNSLPEEMRSITRREFQSYMDGRSSEGLAYMFLHENGKAPEMVITKNIFPKETRNIIEEATNGTFSLFDQDKDNLEKIKNIFIKEKFNRDENLFEQNLKASKAIWEKSVKEGNSKSFRFKKAEQNLELLDEYGFNFRDVESFVWDVKRDISTAGRKDGYETLRKAQIYIEDNGFKGEFNKWVDEIDKRYNIKEVIFNGFTPSGVRRFIPNTLENVSKFMKHEGRNAATGISISFQNFAAGLLKANGNLKDIRSEKNKLVTEHAEVDAFRDKWSEVFYELGIKLQPDAKGYDDYGLYRLAEAAQHNNPQKYIQDKYNISFSDEDVKKLNDMVSAIRNEYPAMYFETKFERPVYLNEFAAAVVPTNTSKEILDAINSAGLQVFSYENGDEASRNEAVNKASEINGVRFRGGDSIGSVTTEQGKIVSEVESLADSLHTPVRTVKSFEELPEGDVARKRIENGDGIKGWFDIKSEEMAIYLPNATSVEDARESVFHEVVGHYGLREMYGEKFNKFLHNVYMHASPEIQNKILLLSQNYINKETSISLATEEYLASLAENGFENIQLATWWEKIKIFFIDFLQSIGINIDYKITDYELKQILYKSYYNLTSKDTIHQENLTKSIELYSSQSKGLVGDVTNIPGEESQIKNLRIKDKCTGKIELLQTNGVNILQQSPEKIKKLLSGNTVEINNNCEVLKLSKIASGWTLNLGKQVLSTADASVEL